MAHSIVHFEIPADDIERARRFYNGLFGWKIEQAPGQTGEGDPYYMIETAEGGLGGGMMKRVVPQQQPVFYVQVESLDDHVDKIKQAGGQIVLEKTPVPTMGWFAQALDTENNAFAIWQDDPQAA